MGLLPSPTPAKYCKSSTTLLADEPEGGVLVPWSPSAHETIDGSDESLETRIAFELELVALPSLPASPPDLSLPSSTFSALPCAWTTSLRSRGARSGYRCIIVQRHRQQCIRDTIALACEWGARDGGRRARKAVEHLAAWSSILSKASSPSSPLSSSAISSSIVFSVPSTPFSDILSQGVGCSPADLYNSMTVPPDTVSTQSTQRKNRFACF
jgi:hypothetical protein